MSFCLWISDAYEKLDSIVTASIFSDKTFILYGGGCMCDLSKPASIGIISSWTILLRSLIKRFRSVTRISVKSTKKMRSCIRHISWCCCSCCFCCCSVNVDIHWCCVSLTHWICSNRSVSLQFHRFFFFFIYFVLVIVRAHAYAEFIHGTHWHGLRLKSEQLCGL